MAGSARFRRDLVLQEEKVRELMDIAPEKVPIRSIMLDQESLRFKDDNHVKRLGESKIRRGRWINYPIIQKNTMQCISGNHRVLAARESGESEILAFVLDCADREAWAIRLEENLLRRKVPKKELYAMFRRARDDWGLTQEAIAERIGMSQQRVSQILSWGDGGFRDGQPFLLVTSKTPLYNSGKGGLIPSDTSERGLGEPDSATSAEMSEKPLPAPDTLVLDLGLEEPGAILVPESIKGFAEPDMPPITGAWTIEQVREHRGKMNAFVQAEIDNIKEDDCREHLGMVYARLGEVLGGN